jgi:hypothetical protein
LLGERQQLGITRNEGRRGVNRFAFEHRANLETARNRLSEVVVIGDDIRIVGLNGYLADAAYPNLSRESAGMYSCPRHPCYIYQHYVRSWGIRLGGRVHDSKSQNHLSRINVENASES